MHKDAKFHKLQLGHLGNNAISYNLIEWLAVTYPYKLIAIMKRTLILINLISFAFIGSAFGQSNQSPVIQQSTSTTDTRQANPAQPKMKKLDKRERKQLETGMDSTLPKNRKKQRLRPDSLRRGGATRVDSVRR